MTVLTDYYKIYQNKIDRRIIGFRWAPYKRYSRSLQRLRKRASNSRNIQFNVMLTLTYSEISVNKACMNDFRKLLNKIKQNQRNKINALKKIAIKARIVNDVHLYEHMKTLYKLYKDNLKKFSYIVKVEFESAGARTYHPHAHILIRSYFWLSKKKIHEWWQQITDETVNEPNLRTITSGKMSKVYVLKYVKKDTEVQEKWQGRTWSCSRDISSIPIAKNWEYVGALTETEYLKLKMLEETDPVANSFLINLLINKAKDVGKHLHMEFHPPNAERSEKLYELIRESERKWAIDAFL